ncbi:MAG: oligosaccharide flippase family protein [Leuconostoc mesenteroides]
MQQRKTGAVLSYVNIVLKNSINLLYTPFLLRFLGNAEYGIYQLAIQVVSTLSLLALGFSGAYVRFYWKLKKEKNESVDALNGLYLTIFSVISFLSLILGGILVFFVPVFFGNTFTHQEITITRVLFGIMVFNVALTFPSSVFDSYIIANQQFKFQQIRALLGTILQPILTIPMLFLGFRSISILSVQTLITIIFLIANVHFSISKLNMKFRFNQYPAGLLRSLFIFSSFLLINDIVDIINNNVPGIIIGGLVGAKAIAIYGIAIQIRTMFIQLSLALSNVFIPRINEIVNFNDSQSDLLNLMIKVGRLQLFILSTIYCGFALVGNFFLEQWAGSGFGLSYWMILLMILPVMVPLSQNLGIEIQRAKNMHQFRSWILALLAIFNLLITFYSVKKWGVIGATFGYIFSVVLGNGLLINLYNHYKVGLNMITYWKKVINVLVPNFISLLILSIIKLCFPIHSFIVFIGYGIVYLIIVFIIAWNFTLNNYEKEIISRRFSNNS